jgi:hypothetical protein
MPLLNQHISIMYLRYNLRFIMTSAVEKKIIWPFLPPEKKLAVNVIYKILNANRNLIIFK